MNATTNTFGIRLTEATYQGRDNRDGWEHDRWTVELERDGGVPMELTYRLGTGHNGRAPELADILESLASDCSTVENDDYDDVLGDMPYSQARRIATELDRQCASVRRLLGDDYEAFWTAER